MFNFIRIIKYTMLFLSVSSYHLLYANSTPECEFEKFSSKYSRDDPTSKMIKIFHYSYGKTSKNRLPILFFSGGPSINSHGSYRTLREAADKYNLRITFFDYRGVGCSTAYPAPVKNNYHRMKKYHSKFIADDAEAVRKHSYGTKVDNFTWLINHKIRFIKSERKKNKEWVSLYPNEAKNLKEIMNSKYHTNCTDIDDECTIIPLHQTAESDLCFRSRESSFNACGIEAFLSLVFFMGYEKG